MRAYLEIAVRNMNLLCHKSINGQSFKVITEFLRNQKYPAGKKKHLVCLSRVDFTIAVYFWGEFSIPYIGDCINIPSAELPNKTVHAKYGRSESKLGPGWVR